MTMKEMYKGKVNSPETLLSEQITAAQTDIKVEDASVLPTGPNLAVIGVGTDAETIKYSSINNNILVGCTRGFQGIAKVWDANTPVARNFTEYDIGSLQDNVEKLNSEKAEKTELFSKNASDLTVDDNNQLVTKAEKTTWNGKQDKLTAGENVSISGSRISATDTKYNKATATADGLMSKEHFSKVDDIPADPKYTDTVYEHPTTHPASMITESVTKRFVSETEKNTWNGKQDKLTAGSNVSISGSTISATDTKYTAGTNVTISGNTISATDTKYTAGENITISGTTISATGVVEISSTSGTDFEATKIGNIVVVKLSKETAVLPIGYRPTLDTVLPIGKMNGSTPIAAAIVVKSNGTLTSSSTMYGTTTITFLI